MRTSTVKFNYPKLTNGVIVSDKLVVKGATKILYDFTYMIETDFKAASITIDWGDGTPNTIKKKNVSFNYRTQSIFDEILYGALGGSVFTVYEHEYSNNSKYYGRNYYSRVTVVWEDGSYTHFIQPILVVWDSFYDDIQDLSLLSTQLLPISSNKTFTNLESKYDGTTLIGTLDTTGIPLADAKVVQNITELDVFGFGDEGNLATSDYEQILFPFVEGEMFIRIVLGYEVNAFENCIDVIDNTKIYTITPNRLIINEGDSVQFNITTENVPSGTRLNYELSRSDVTPNTGQVVITNNQASFIATSLVTSAQEGDREFTVRLIDVGSGGLVATSVPVKILDSIVPPPTPNLGIVTFTNAQVDTFASDDIFPF